MASSKNERATDLIVAQKLKDAGIKFCPNGSSIADIRKVSSLRRSGKQRGRYTQKAKAICWSCWTAAANHEEVWRSVNTRITYKAVFDYYHARLAQVGVNDHNAFRDVIHAETMRRNRELSARQDAARQKRNAATSGNITPPKYVIIHAVKNTARATVTLALTTMGAMAAPLRSDASGREVLTPPPRSSGVAYAQRSAVPDAARAEVCGHVVKVAHGDTITMLS